MIRREFFRRMAFALAAAGLLEWVPSRLVADGPLPRGDVVTLSRADGMFSSHRYAHVQQLDGSGRVLSERVAIARQLEYPEGVPVEGRYFVQLEGEETRQTVCVHAYG